MCVCVCLRANNKNDTGRRAFLQVVCCRLTPVQTKIYKHLMSSKEIRHILNGKQTNILSSIGAMQKVTWYGVIWYVVS